MLKRLCIQNFKTFSEPILRLPLARLTILLGPNGSGKTGILEALGLFSQTAEDHSPRDGFRWSGKWVDFGSNGLAAIHKGNVDAQMALGVVLEPDLDAPKWYSESINDSLQPPTQIHYFVSTGPRSREWRHVCVVGELEATNEFIPGPNRQPTLRIQAPGIPPETVFGPQMHSGAVLNGQLFGIGQVMTGQQLQNDLLQRTSQEFFAAVGYLREWLTHKVFLIGPDRMPHREEQNLQKWDLSVGRRGEHTINLLSYIFASAEHAEIAEKIQYWGNIFNLRGLKAGFARRKDLGASFTDPETGTPLGLEYAGYGSQQILPVLTQIFAAPKGSLILIEEPEISLHPAAQINLMSLFADGIKFGQQILITTHSSTLPLALSEVERSGLTPQDIAIYHLSASSTGTSVQRLEVDQNWSVTGWIPSFSEVEQKLLKKWIEKVDLGRAQES